MRLMIAEQDLQRIAAANDIVDLIQGYFPLKRAGTVYKALCPFHREKSPSFSVNPARQTFKCFGCGAGGTVFKFVQLYESVSFPEAVKRLAARRGIHFEDEPLSEEASARQRQRKRLLALHAEAATWFHTQLLRTKAAQPARDYLKKRGFTSDVAKTWKLGYAPESWDAFSRWAKGEGYHDHELLASGLVSPREDRGYYDRFRDRLMIPICDDMGQVVAFSGRVLSPDAKGAKYVNSPETPLFTKGKLLFGLHRAKRALVDKKAAIVCEGQIDLITAVEAGVENIIASQGTAFTKDQALMVKRYTGGGEVILCYDSDAAGQKAADRSLAILLGMGLSVRVASFPDGHDPDSFIRTCGADAFIEQIARAPDYFDSQLERFAASPESQTPRGKSDFAARIAPSVALISDIVMREATINNISRHLEIPPEQFASLLKRAKETTWEEPERPWSDSPSAEPEAAPEPPVPPMSNTVKLLTQLVLHDMEALRWLMAQPWEELLRTFVDTELLMKIVRADLAGKTSPLHGNTGADSAALAAFLSTLSGPEQSLLAELLDGGQPSAEPITIAQDCWNDLLRKSLVQKRNALFSRLASPGLSPEEEVNLQKQVLDLTQQLTHIARPLSSPP